MNALVYLLSTVFDLYIMVVLLRAWLQIAEVDFYNPFSQFVVKSTQPVVGPLRRIIPAIGRLDISVILFAFVLCTLKFIALLLLSKASFPPLGFLFIISGLSLLKAIGTLLFWVLLLRSILSWVSQGQNPVEYVFYQLTEPMLAPIRRIIPVMGGFDFSVLVLFIVLQFSNYLIGDLLGSVGINWGGI